MCGIVHMNLSLPLPLRGRSLRIVGALAAATALVALADPALAAGKLDGKPASTTGSIEMELAGNGVADGGTIDASFALTGDDEQIVVTRGDALTSIDAVTDWLAGSGSATTGITQVAVAGGDDEVTASLSFENLPSGVYPVAAKWDGAEERSLVYVPTDGAQGIALVVPITAPTISAGILSASELTELTAKDGALTAQLDAVTGTAAILAVDPAIPAAIRALGTTTPATATEWLERLLALPNDRFALQYGDADVAVQIDAGLEAPLAPTHLGNYLTDSATATTLSSLLDIGAGSAGLFYWPAPGSADDDVVDALARDNDARVLVPASSTAADAPALGGEVLAYDDALAGSLLSAAREEDPEARDLAIELARAQLWITEAEAEEPLIVAFDRGEADELSVALHAATALSSQAPLGLGEVLDASGGSVALDEATPDAERIDAIGAYLDAQAGLTTISTALAHPAAFLGETRAELQQLLAVGWNDDAEGWSARAESLAALNIDRAGAIEMQQQQPVQLLSGSAPMPVWIRNDLPYAAEVTIIAISDDPRLVIEERTVVTAQPDSVTRAKVDVKARIGSGDVMVHYTLESAAGTQIGPTRDVDVTVRASWERVGLGVIGAMTVLFLGIGAVRQVRRRRRTREAE